MFLKSIGKPSTEHIHGSYTHTHTHTHLTSLNLIRMTGNNVFNTLMGLYMLHKVFELWGNL